MPLSALLRAVSLLGGFGGLATYLYLLPLPIALGTVPHVVATLLVTAALMGGAAGLAGRADDGAARSLREELSSGIVRIWPAAAPLAGLAPVALSRLLDRAHVDAWIVLAALLVAAHRMRQRSDAGLLAGARARLGAWELGLLACTMLGIGWYLLIGSRAHGSHQNDSAYYYGVARHMAQSGRFEEPIVWHFMHPPAELKHAPFDYWGPLTSLLFVPIVALSSASHGVALLAASAISALSLLAFLWVVCIAAPVRTAAVQWVALLLFAFSPAMAVYRFDTESLSIFHLTWLLALGTYARRRWALAALFGFLGFLARPDGAFGAAVLWAACLWSAARVDRRTLLVTAGLMLGLVSLWMARNLAAFGLPVTAASEVWAVREPFELYTLHRGKVNVPALLQSRLSLSFFGDRIAATYTTLRDQRFVPSIELWLLLTALPGIGLFRRRPAHETLAFVMTAASAALVSWTAPGVYVSWRTLHPLLPGLILAGAYGADGIVDRVRVWADEGRSGWARRLAATAGIFGVAWLAVSDLEMYGDRPRSMLETEEAAIERADGVLAGGAVASNLPWYVIAHTRSPAVSIPVDGESSMAEVLVRYHVKWLLLVDRSPIVGRSSAAIERLVNGKRGAIGRLRCEQVSSEDGIALFSVGGTDG